MLQNIGKLTVLVTLNLLVALTAFSQSITLSKSGDTLLCFNKSRSAFLLKQYYASQELRQQTTIDSLKISILQEEVRGQKRIVAERIILEKMMDSEIAKRDSIIIECSKQIKLGQRQVRIERSKTFLVAVAGTSGFLFMSYLWVSTLLKK